MLISEILTEYKYYRNVKYFDKIYTQITVRLGTFCQRIRLECNH